MKLNNMTAEDIVEILNKGLADEFKNQLYAKLMVQAEEIAKETASEIADRVSKNIEGVVKSPFSDAVTVNLNFNMIENMPENDSCIGKIVRVENGCPVIAWDLSSSTKRLDLTGKKIYVV